jgi:hypothetical protein
MHPWTEDQKLQKRAFETLGLSARAYDRIVIVVRTTADLAESEEDRNRPRGGDEPEVGSQSDGMRIVFRF